MPGSFVDDVCDRERPAQRIGGYTANCRRCAQTTSGGKICTGKCFEQPGPTVLEFPGVVSLHEYVAICNCLACRDGVARTVTLARGK